MKQGQDLAVTKESTERLRTEQSAFIAESREVIGLLKDMAIEGKAQQVQAKQAQDIIFTKMRETNKHLKELEEKFIEHRAAGTVLVSEVIEKQVRPMKLEVEELKKFKQLQESKSLLLKDVRVTIPVICTLIVTSIMLWEKFIT